MTMHPNGWDRLLAVFAQHATGETRTYTTSGNLLGTSRRAVVCDEDGGVAWSSDEDQAEDLLAGGALALEEGTYTLSRGVVLASFVVKDGDVLFPYWRGEYSSGSDEVAS